MADPSGKVADLTVEAVLAAAEQAQSCRSDLGEGAGARADRACHLAMVAVLGGDIPVVSEEDPASHRHPLDRGYVLLIDPLDGTAAFERGEPDRAHLAALLLDGRPVHGVIAAPSLGVLVRGDARASCCEVSDLYAPGDWRPIGPPDRPDGGGVLLIGQGGLTSEALEVCRTGGFEGLMLVDCGAAFVHLALGHCQAILKSHPVRPWDVAAGDAILRSVGLRVEGRDGRALEYGSADARIGGFRAGAAAVLGRLPTALQRRRL